LRKFKVKTGVLLVFMLPELFSRCVQRGLKLF